MESRRQSGSRDWIKVEYPKREFPVCHIEWGTPDSKGSFRLSGYWYTFREPNEQFRAGTSIRIVWEHYVFDRKLRLLVMDAVERIEVAVRPRLSYELAHTFGPFGYVHERRALSSASLTERDCHLDQIRDNAERNRKEQFVAHFFQKYGDTHQPIWMASEVLSFGTIVRLLNDSHPDIRRQSIRRSHDKVWVSPTTGNAARCPWAQPSKIL
ncbi:MAG: Abi family protein [Myxococcales bacterium]